MLQITTTPIETHRNIVLTERERMQTKLHALASMAVAAAGAVDADGSVFHTKQGRALVNAAYDVFEKDDLYDFAQDLEREFGGPDLLGETIASIWGSPRA